MQPPHRWKSGFAVLTPRAPQVPHGPDELHISKELPHLVGKCVYFVRNSLTVSAKEGITAKSIENDVSWCVSRRLPAVVAKVAHWQALLAAAAPRPPARAQ